MCTAKDKGDKSHNKTEKIAFAMASDMVKHIVFFIRVYLNKVIDFLFSLVWHDHQPLPPLEDKHKILLESATSLAQKIRNKELKSEQLVRACIERIKAVNPIINAVTDERYVEALDEAREVDAMIAKGLPDEYFKDKPLLGVPFSAKESHGVRGLLWTWGLRCRRQLRATKDARCVGLLRAAGGLSLCVTNVPELNKWQETRSGAFGRTNNPHNTTRTVGGSSGGEAALMAALGVPISLCSDIGGSTRMPAFYCGLFGHNPTGGTTSMEGSVDRSGDEDTMASVGVVTRHAEDLGPLTTLLSEGKLKFDEEVDIKKVRFYYLESASDVRVSPINGELRKLMQQVIQKVSTVSEPPKKLTHEGFDHMFSLWKYHMTKEKEDFAVKITNNKYRAVWYIELAKKLFGLSEYSLATILKLIDDQVLPVPDKQWAETLTDKMRADIIELLGPDGVLLAPSSPRAAPHHYSALVRPFDFAYWAIYNVLRLPATQVPLGVNSESLPLGLQVVASPRRDVVAVTVAAWLAEHWGGVVTPCKVY